MFDYINMRYFHILETLINDGFSTLLKKIIYINREAILVEYDLVNLQARADDSESADLKLIEITPEIINNNSYIFTFKNRLLKTLHYLEKGYSGYGIVKEKLIIGDIWYVVSKDSKDILEHPDLKWLGIKCPENHAYSFDMFLDSGMRGYNISTLFQSRFLQNLQKKRVVKVYGYYWSDNIPALWIHRILKWKEIKRIKVSRFFIFRVVSKKHRLMTLQSR